MKIKEGFMLRSVADNYVVVPVGKASLELKGLINLNSVGAFIWKCLENDTTILKVINKVGGDNYSNTEISQEILTYTEDKGIDFKEKEIDLEASDWILYNDGDTMMEIKYPEKDIKIKIKER
jgi:hypothetical protein